MRTRAAALVRGATAAVLLLALTSPVTTSYLRALAAPGAASLSVRSVDWARDHGAAPLVNGAENLWYSLHAPSNTPPPSASLPAAAANPGSCGRGRDTATPLPVPALPLRLAGEGVWVPHLAAALGHPILCTSFFRPDPQHASVVVGVALIRTGEVAAHLVAGTVQPGGLTGGRASVAPDDRSSLIATFNSGWRMADIRGGFLLGRQTARPLVDGQATAAIDDSGRLTVGAWGRDLGPTAHLVAARQNLELIVDGGQMAPGLDLNAHGQWGTPKNQFQYTARSALGVDARGALIYVVGSDLDLQTLARSLVDAGAVRGMELDIHNGMQTFSWWDSIGTGPPRATKLLPSLVPPAERYLVPDQRDFFYLTLRSRRRP